MTKKQHDLVVIGAGPGGYIAALRGAQLGLNVACIDENRQLGGTCLRVGCIPSKAMLESSEKYREAQETLGDHGVNVQGVELDLATMLKRKDKVVQTLTGGVQSLLKRSKIETYHGRGRLGGKGKVVVTTDDGEQELRAKHIIIATGSQPAAIPGIEFDGKHVGSSTDALSYEEVPDHLVVVGAGYIGLEMGSVWNRLGSKVTVIEALDRILPGMDAELAKHAQEIFAKQGLEFGLAKRLKKVNIKKGRCVVECEGDEPIQCDRVLIAVGRRPNTKGLDLESVGLSTDDKGRIEVDRHYATKAEGVYAIGDCIAGPMLAHKASDEGVACVERIVTGYGWVNYDAIPAVVYTHPEIASVGFTEQQLKDAGRDFEKGLSPFRANGRARTLGDVEGFVKILAEKDTDRVLGVHILGPRAGDLIAEAAAAIHCGASVEDLQLCPHAHPTLSEAVREGALAVHHRALNH